VPIDDGWKCVTDISKDLASDLQAKDEASSAGRGSKDKSIEPEPLPAPLALTSMKEHLVAFFKYLVKINACAPVEAYWHIALAALIKDKVMVANPTNTKKIMINRFSVLRKRMKKIEYGETKSLKPRDSDPDFVHGEGIIDDLDQDRDPGVGTSPYEQDVATLKAFTVRNLLRIWRSTSRA